MEVTSPENKEREQLPVYTLTFKLEMPNYNPQGPDSLTFKGTAEEVETDKLGEKLQSGEEVETDKLGEKPQSGKVYMIILPGESSTYYIIPVDISPKSTSFAGFGFISDQMINLEKTEQEIGVKKTSIIGSTDLNTLNALRISKVIVMEVTEMPPREDLEKALSDYGPLIETLYKKWSLRDSNPRPFGCEPNALTSCAKRP